jgi:hypothetical protein
MWGVRKAKIPRSLPSSRTHSSWRIASAADQIYKILKVCNCNYLVIVSFLIYGMLISCKAILYEISVFNYLIIVMFEIRIRWDGVKREPT